MNHSKTNRTEETAIARSVQCRLVGRRDAEGARERKQCANKIALSVRRPNFCVTVTGSTRDVSACFGNHNAPTECQKYEK